MKSLGIWLGFENKVSAKREGISRYVYFLADYLIRSFNVKIEVWVYSLNKNAFEELFSEQIKTKMLTIHTETSEIVKNEEISSLPSNYLSKIENTNYYKSQFSKSKFQFKFYQKVEILIMWIKAILHTFFEFRFVWFNIFITFMAIIIYHTFGVIYSVLSVFLFTFFFTNKSTHLIYLRKIFPRKKTFDHLSQVTNQQSKAEIFLVPYCGLFNAKFLKFKKVIAIHDLISIEFFKDFAENLLEPKHLIESNLNILNFLSDEAKNGSYFTCNSTYVLENQAIKYVPNIHQENATSIVLPHNIPENLPDKIDLDKRLVFNEPYIFYPTQIRPYKNVDLLIKAIRLLKDEGILIRLVLTASNIDEKHQIFKLIQELNVKDLITFTGDLSDFELMEMYRRAKLVVAASKFEGGFPWPAQEALAVETPVIFADIPVIRERIEMVGLKDTDDIGLLFFNPYSEADLAEKIKIVLSSSVELSNKQKSIKSAVQSYTWKDTAKCYLDYFNKILENSPS